MDINKVHQLSEIASKQVEIAERYSKVRLESAKAESSLKIILTASLGELRKSKKNVGVEFAILMLCEENEVAKRLYSEWITKEAEYKGLERLLDARSSQLIFEQSVMKFTKEGERYG